MTIPFTKMHGAGNDFIVLDGMNEPLTVSGEAARRMCDRHFGVGADQILLLEKSEKADFRMRIFNADGSEVEMCGNGIRCAAVYARKSGYVAKDDMAVETLAGLIRPVVRADGLVRVDMGAPALEAGAIPTRAKTPRVIDQPLSSLKIGRRQSALGGLFFTCVSMGNPHCVIFVKSLNETPVEAWGPLLERQPFFPKRINVEFVEVQSPDLASVRVWERGAGLTLACGTGACAVGVAGVLTGRLHRSVTLSLPGGKLGVEWAADNRVYLTGPVELSFQGGYNVS